MSFKSGKGAHEVFKVGFLQEVPLRGSPIHKHPAYGVDNRSALKDKGAGEDERCTHVTAVLKSS